MNNHAKIPIAHRALNRSAYATRTAGCVAGIIGYGFTVGLLLGPAWMTDPDAFALFLSLSMVGNIVVGIFFVVLTHRRALDCTFGKSGRPGIATVAALPTLILPQYGLLVFAVMMFIKSAPQSGETSEIENDSGVLRPLQAGE